jgi:hypothetical protein
MVDDPEHGLTGGAGCEEYGECTEQEETRWFPEVSRVSRGATETASDRDAKAASKRCSGARRNHDAVTVLPFHRQVNAL